MAKLCLEDLLKEKKDIFLFKNKKYSLQSLGFITLFNISFTSSIWIPTKLNRKELIFAIK